MAYRALSKGLVLCSLSIGISLLAHTQLTYAASSGQYPNNAAANNATVDTLNGFTFDSATGNLSAQLSHGLKTPNIIQYPKGQMVRTIWEFSRTEADNPDALKTSLTTQLSAIGIQQVKFSIYPGHTIRVVIDTPKAIAANNPSSNTRNNTNNLSPSITLANTRTNRTDRIGSPSQTKSYPAYKPAIVHSPQQVPSNRYTAYSYTAQSSVQPVEKHHRIVTPPEPSTPPVTPTIKAAPVRTKTVAVNNQPTTSLTSLKATLESSKQALAKSIKTINQQNEAIQKLKAQLAELQQAGLSAASLDQQTWLDDQLTKTEHEKKKIQAELDKLRRENQSLKVVVARLEKDGPIYEPVTAVAQEG